MNLKTCLTLVAFNLAYINAQVLIEDSCDAVPDLFIKNRTRELECCQNVSISLYHNWSVQGAYLTRTLATLQAWNCPQFNEACLNRSLDFTDYTSLIYDRFCNQSSLLQRCGSVVNNALSSSDIFTDLSNTNWTSLAMRLNSNTLTMKQLDQPCIQVALYDSKNTSWRNYYEIITFVVPFCNSAWCGFDYETIQKNNISPWTCLPARCKANIIILAVLFIILAMIIVIGNFTVILVYSTAKKLRHSQGVFRLSLGFADIIIGLITLPAAINSIFETYQHALKLQTPTNVSGFERIFNTNSNYTYVNSTKSVTMLQSSAFEVFSLSYLNSIGFFTTLSLTVSIYLLTLSGVDRLCAVAQPLKYRQYAAKRFALISAIICYIAAFLLSIIPIFVKSLRYIITSSSFITLGGTTALILYLVGFFLPLLVTWFLTIAIYFEARKKFRKKTELTSAKQKHFKQQRKLNMVLSLMVTAFSLSMLPTILVLVLVLFIPGTDPRVPNSYRPFFNNIANSLETTAVIALISNSLWNCLIYSVRTTSFRKVAKEKYKNIWNKINLKNYISTSQQEMEMRPRAKPKPSALQHKTHTTGIESCSITPLTSRSNSPLASKRSTLNNSVILQTSNLVKQE